MTGKMRLKLFLFVQETFCDMLSKILYYKKSIIIEHFYVRYSIYHFYSMCFRLQSICINRFNTCRIKMINCKMS